MTAAQIHNLKIQAEPIESRRDAAASTIPRSARRPSVWKTAFGILREPAPAHPACFVHGDFQHFNLLWRRGRLSGVVDWAASGIGPSDRDIGHCRLNLAVLFGVERAEQLRLANQAEAGRVIDPWWDLYAVTAYNDEWRTFIPQQVAGRALVDLDGMTDRVEQLLETILRRV